MISDCEDCQVGFAAFLAMQSLIGRYCGAVLRYDLELFSRCWANDATWAVPGERVLSGRKAIVQAFARIRPTYLRCMQQIVGVSVDSVAKSIMSATVQVREVQWRTDGTGSELLGLYHDAIRFGRDGTAEYVERDFELLYNGPLDLSGNLRTPRAARNLPQAVLAGLGSELKE